MAAGVCAVAWWVLLVPAGDDQLYPHPADHLMTAFCTASYNLDSGGHRPRSVLYQVEGKVAGTPRIKSVVAVEGHPDDVELGCLGTLLKLRDEGTRITIVSVTAGDQGTGDNSTVGDSISAMRFREASSVANRLGGEFVTLGARDGYLFDTSDLRDALTILIRRARPEVVFAPPPMDYHHDHINAGQIAFTAVYHAVTQPIEGTRLQRTPALYYFDAAAGVEFNPSFLIDISAQIAEKRELAALHVSQMANMKAIGGWDLVEYIEVVGRYRGLQAATQYAEAFQSCLRWPRAPALQAFPF